MAEVPFSIMQLIEESKERGERFVTPTKESFGALEESFSFTRDKTYYEIAIEKKR
ncbi:MAG: hypothetical protein LBP85_00130 [Prevotellaceae bacterium]|jgi:hypothetical protein|nr:hypothetical protein [Prevotellaceae bacterium]